MTTTRPKPFVFVLMPFSKDFDDVYQVGIRPACEAAGAYAERVDEQHYDGTILDRIYNQISKADVIVSEMTGRNPNVFYETGYAHALGKQVILLTRNADDIPFDLKNYPHIVHAGRIVDLVPNLTGKMKWALDTRDSSAESTRAGIEFYVEAISLSESPVICYRHPALKVRRFEFKLDLHNSIQQHVETQIVKIGFRTSANIEFVRDESFSRNARYLNTIALPEGGSLYLDNSPVELLPDSWDSRHYSFGISPDLSGGGSETLFVRAYSSSGLREYGFTIRIAPGHDEKHPSIVRDDDF